MVLITCVSCAPAPIWVHQQDIAGERIEDLLGGAAEKEPVQGRAGNGTHDHHLGLERSRESRKHEFGIAHSQVALTGHDSITRIERFEATADHRRVRFLLRQRDGYRNRRERRIGHESEQRRIRVSAMQRGVQQLANRAAGLDDACIEGRRLVVVMPRVEGRQHRPPVRAASFLDDEQRHGTMADQLVVALQQEPSCQQAVFVCLDRHEIGGRFLQPFDDAFAQ